jgi:hypothetical protein
LTLVAIFALAIHPACGDEVTPPDDEGSGATGGSGVPSTATAVTSTTTGGGQMLSCLGGYTDIAKGTCDLLSQDCPYGMGCVPQYISGQWTTGCAPHPGAKGKGDPCLTNESCEAGLFCVFGRCSPICCPATEEPCAEDGGLCGYVQQGFGNRFASVCTYLESCDLFTADCVAGEHCYPLVEEANSFCVPTSLDNTRGEGESCTALNDCDDSMLCNGNPAVCRWACYLEASGSPLPGAGGCPAGQTCTLTGTNPPDNIGVCLP